jgi:hypothetical protein
MRIVSAVTAVTAGFPFAGTAIDDVQPIQDRFGPPGPFPLLWHFHAPLQPR